MSLIVGPVSVSGVPSLESCVSTISNKISEATIAEFNSKVQVKVTSEPRTGRELGLELWSLLTSVMDDGLGTLLKLSNDIISIDNNMILYMHHCKKMNLYFNHNRWLSQFHVLFLDHNHKLHKHLTGH